MDRALAKIGNERGAALLVALATFAIISVLGVAALTVASGSVDLTVWDKSSNQAFQVAEGGFNKALARARAGTLASGGNFTAKFANGEASVTVTNINNFMYVVKSVGAQPDFDEPKAKRAVQGVITAIDPHKVFFADGSQGVVLGSSTIDGPLYVRDILDFSGNGAFTTGPLFIKDIPTTLNPTGDLVMGGSASVGTAANPIYAFIDGTYPASNPNLHTTAIYTDVPDLTMPVITGDDMPQERADADVVIDNDGNTDGDTPLTLNRNAPDQTHGVYPGGSYLKWTRVGNSRRLEIKGTIFVDGSVSLGASQITNIEYQGTGTILSNGNIALNSQTGPNPTSDFPNDDALGLVTPYQVDLDPKANDYIYAIVYAYEKIRFVKAHNFFGTAITQLMDVRSNPHITIVQDIETSEMPPSMPEVEGQTFITGWQEVQP